MKCRLAVLLPAMALAASAQNGGSVQGRVISSLHSEPVAKAVVTLRQSGSGAQIYMCQSGADGRFSIAGVPPGIYDARPAKQGYETRPTPPVTVEAGKAVTTLELQLTPDSVIAGKVLDSDGEPVRYAQVEAQQYGYLGGKRELRTVRQAQTNDRGEYRMFYLPPGRYYLRAQGSPRSSRLTMMTTMRGSANVSGNLPASSVSAAYYPGVADPIRATELQAQPGAELDGIDFSLAAERLYSIRGKLSGGDPAKARSAIRIIDRSENDRRPQYSIIDKKDSYEVVNIAPGRYFVFGESTSPDNREERQYARQQVEVVDRDVDGVDLAFSPGVRVTGTVKVEGSTPLSVETLGMFLQPADFQAQEQTRIGPDGKFASVEIAPGTYQFGIAGRNAYLKSVRVGNQDAAGWKIDTEHLSGPVTVVVSADFGRVEGTVSDDAGKPVFNAYVTLISDFPDRFLDGFTTAAGKFNFNAEPGDYRVFAWLGVERDTPQNADFRKPYEERGAPIKVEANGRQSLDLKAIVVTGVNW